MTILTEEVPFTNAALEIYIKGVMQRIDDLSSETEGCSD